MGAVGVRLVIPLHVSHFSFILLCRRQDGAYPRAPSCRRITRPSPGQSLPLQQPRVRLASRLDAAPGAAWPGPSAPCAPLGVACAPRALASRTAAAWKITMEPTAFSPARTLERAKARARMLSALTTSQDS